MIIEQLSQDHPDAVGSPSNGRPTVIPKAYQSERSAVVSMAWRFFAGRVGKKR